jgi:hypothetical protein
MSTAAADDHVDRVERPRAARIAAFSHHTVESVVVRKSEALLAQM